MPSVRQATMDDLPALAAFDEWNAATEARVQDGQCWVVTVDEEVRAFGVYDRSFMTRPFIAILYVHADHRRTGLGSLLMDRFESMTTAPKVWISTNIENLAMQAALHRRGYRLAGVVHGLADAPELFYFKVLRSC